MYVKMLEIFCNKGFKRRDGRLGIRITLKKKITEMKCASCVFFNRNYFKLFLIMCCLMLVGHFEMNQYTTT